MNRGKICVSVCAKSASEVLHKLGRADADADLFEIRFDCLDPEDVSQLIEKLDSVSKPLLITFRPSQEGGCRDLSLDDRRGFWKAISSRFNGKDLLVDHELDLKLPEVFTPDRTIRSWHDFGTSPRDLSERIRSLTGGAAAKVAVSINSAEEGVEVWKLLDGIGTPVVPIAMGEAGKWTRILGLAHGAPMTYASTDDDGKTAPGQISASDLRNVFRVKELDRDTRVFGLIAADTSYSLSPHMHNRAFRTVGSNSVFVPLQTRDLNSFMRRMVLRGSREVELNFGGFSVTNPHKQLIMKYLDDVDETAREIGAANTVKVNGGKLTGHNTDAPGFIRPLKDLFGDLKGSRAFVAGAGGASRACIYALKNEGVKVTVLARDKSRADSLAEEFDISASTLTAVRHSLDTEILVNATPLGTRGQHEDVSIAVAEELGGVKLVYDLVYKPSETRLLREAKKAGAKALGGLEMLVAQGARQFEIWTGNKAPAEEMKAAIEERLK